MTVLFVIVLSISNRFAVWKEWSMRGPSLLKLNGFTVLFKANKKVQSYCGGALNFVTYCDILEMLFSKFNEFQCFLIVCELDPYLNVQIELTIL